MPGLPSRKAPCGARAHPDNDVVPGAIDLEKPDRPNVLPGKVIDIAYLGNLSTYHVELPDGTMMKAQTANTRRLSRRDITWEDNVWLSFTDTAGVLLER